MSTGSVDQSQIGGNTMRTKLPKGFIPLGGNGGNSINIDCVAKVTYDKEKNKVYLKDKFGMNYTVDPSAVKGKIEL